MINIENRFNNLKMKDIVQKKLYVNYQNKKQIINQNYFKKNKTFLEHGKNLKY